MPKVINIRNVGTRNIPVGAVYVGRPTKWGNPFRIGEAHPADGHKISREESIELYRNALPNMLAAKSSNGQPILNLEELHGKDLACWCAPLPCHADILLELANK